MARGSPDYQSIATSTVRLEQGNVNASAFDTGFSRMDGGGRVVFYDDFRAGVYRYQLDVDGGANLPELDFSEGHMFGFSPSMKLDPLVNGGITGFHMFADMPASGKIGYEFSVYLINNHGRVATNFAMAFQNGANYYFGLKIDDTTHAISLQTVPGYDLVFTPILGSYFLNRNITLKLIVDPAHGTYDKLFVGAQMMDVSSHTAPQGFTNQAGATYLDFYHEGRTAVIKEEIWLNYLIFSADEP
jgi:hypothetical protein